MLLERRNYTRDLEEKVRAADRWKSGGAHEETIHRLVTASLCRDEETGMHIRRTGLLSEALARAAGWSAADAEVIRLAAPMHDVGKIGIPDAILRKPGKLTPAEFEIMKTHTTIGAKMLAGSHSAILLDGPRHRLEPPRALGRRGLSARAGRARRFPRPPAS